MITGSYYSLKELIKPLKRAVHDCKIDEQHLRDEEGFRKERLKIKRERRRYTQLIKIFRELSSSKKPFTLDIK